MPATLRIPLTFDQLLIAAWQLEPEERLALAEQLTGEIPDGPPHEDKEDGYDEAWRAEVKQRLKDIDEGKVEMVPWEQVMAKLDKAVGR